MANTILDVLYHPEVKASKSLDSRFTEAFPTYFHLYYEQRKQSFLLNIISAKEADYTYTIKDILGNIFQKGEISTNPQDFQLCISTLNITQGIYTFRLEPCDGSQAYICHFFVNET